VTIFEVPPGGARFARASFGAVAPLRVDVVPTLPAPGNARLVLYGSLSGDGPVVGARMAAWILGPPGEDPYRVPMGSVSGDPGEFVAVLDLSSAPVASGSRYFLEATTQEKDTVTSEILPLLPGTRAHGSRPATRPPARGTGGEASHPTAGNGPGPAGAPAASAPPSTAAPADTTSAGLLHP
jgi:hypothetical protein